MEWVTLATIEIYGFGSNREAHCHENRRPQVTSISKIALTVARERQ